MKYYSLRYVDSYEARMIECACKQAVANGEALTILVDSDGGGAVDGLSVYGSIQEAVAAGADITVDVKSKCMSAATMVLCAVPLAKRRASSHSTYLPHETRYGFATDIKEKDAKDLFDSLVAINGIYLDIFGKSTTATPAELEDIFRSEAIMNASQMQALGFVGEIYESGTMPATPEDASESPEAESEGEKIEIEIEIYDKAREYALVAYAGKNKPVATVATGKTHTAKAADVPKPVISMSGIKDLWAKISGLPEAKQNELATQLAPAIEAAADPNAAIMAKLEDLTKEVAALKANAAAAVEKPENEGKDADIVAMLADMQAKMNATADLVHARMRPQPSAQFTTKDTQAAGGNAPAPSKEHPINLPIK